MFVKSIQLLIEALDYSLFISIILMDTEENNIPQNAHTSSNGNQSASTTTSPASEKIPVTTFKKNTLMAILAYISVFIIIPYLMAKDDEFVKFHIKQGLVLVVIGLIAWFAGMMLWGLYPLLMLVNVATLVLSIIGIINVLQGNKKELPLVGQFAKKFTV